jgi:hypothetical protein
MRNAKLCEISTKNRLYQMCSMVSKIASKKESSSGFLGSFVTGLRQKMYSQVRQCASKKESSPGFLGRIDTGLPQKMYS